VACDAQLFETVQRVARDHALDVSYLPFDWDGHRTTGIVDSVNRLLELLAHAPPPGAAVAAAAAEAPYGHGELILLAGPPQGTDTGPDGGLVSEPSVRLDRCPDGRSALMVRSQPQAELLRLCSVHAMTPLIDSAFFAHLPYLGVMLQTTVDGP